MKRFLSILLVCVLLLACAAPALADTWSCPDCGNNSNTGKYCGTCGKKRPVSRNVGEIITLGYLDQDNNSYNGEEPIEWIVLAVSGSKMLLISRYLLEYMPYNDSYSTATWETSTLRTWLNGDFYNSAFSDSDKNLIQLTYVSGILDAEISSQVCGSTYDYVFLLSKDEAQAYFQDDISRTCTGTRRLQAKYGSLYSAQTMMWWLRSSCSGKVSAMWVGMLGDCSRFRSDYNTSNSAGVRPCMWVTMF